MPDGLSSEPPYAPGDSRQIRNLRHSARIRFRSSASARTVPAGRQLLFGLDVYGFARCGPACRAYCRHARPAPPRRRGRSRSARPGQVALRGSPGVRHTCGAPQRSNVAVRDLAARIVAKAAGPLCPPPTRTGRVVTPGMRAPCRFVPGEPRLLSPWSFRQSPIGPEYGRLACVVTRRSRLRSFGMAVYPTEHGSARTPREAVRLGGAGR